MTDDLSLLRRRIYWLLIAIAFAIACARIVSVQRVYEPSLFRDEKIPSDRRTLWPKTRPNPMPTFGSNDRSRWATIRALVDDGTYVIGRRDPKATWTSAAALFAATDPMQAVCLAQAGYHVRTKGSHSGIIFTDGWETIDVVMNPDTLEFYSSKPPLLATLLAGLYWVFKALFGWSLAKNPEYVVRATLLLINGLPYLLYLRLLVQIAETWGKTDWARLYLVAAGAFATMLTPFLITLNNHSIATCCVMLAWWSVLCIWRDLTRGQPPSWLHFLNAGFFAAFAVPNDLPALAFAAAIFVLLLWWSPSKALLGFLPAALVPAIAFFGTNYAAIGEFTPAYEKFGGPWYEYEGSHWKPPPEELKHTKVGIDWAKYQESRATYAMHVLVGHHGLFTLTPIWLLALAAMLAACWHWRDLWRQALFRSPGEFPWFVQPLGLTLTIVVVGFYLYKSDNYAGWSNGLRWLMWLTPIWLTCVLPIADRLALSRVGRWLALILLAVSIFTVSYELWNPWRQPWLYDLMIEFGWPGYGVDKPR